MTPCPSEATAGPCRGGGWRLPRRCAGLGFLWGPRVHHAPTSARAFICVCFPAVPLGTEVTWSGLPPALLDPAASAQGCQPHGLSGRVDTA